MVNESTYQGFGRSTISGRQHEIKHLTTSPDWAEAIYMWEDGDRFIGGERGLGNLQAQQLGNRTEWLYNAVAYLLNYLQSYSPDGATKVKSVISSSPPEDSNTFALIVDGEETDTNPELLVTTEDGEQFNLFDGKTIVVIDGMRYALVGENAGMEDKPFVTIPGGNDTQSGGQDTVPSGGEDTVPADVTVPADTVPSGDDDNYAGQGDYDTLLSDLFGGD